MWDGGNWADLSDLSIEGVGLKARVSQKPRWKVHFRRELPIGEVGCSLPLHTEVPCRRSEQWMRSVGRLTPESKRRVCSW